jgi:methionyl aminopeptidase
MAIILKSNREIDLMHQAGKIVGDVLSKLKKAAQPGVTTAELDAIAVRMCEQAGADPLFRGVPNPYGKQDFPGAICASLNEQIVHGIPSDKVKLKEGDILSVDFGVRLNGYCGDAAVTIPVGDIPEQKKKLLETTKNTLAIAVENCKDGVKWSRIAGKMQEYAESRGFSVVREFVGHGIGREMHEDPKVPNYVSKNLQTNDILLKTGMVIAVEPMINIGTYKTKVLKDGWTVVTADGKSSAHFEHSIAITDDGCKVLTEN